MVTLAVAVDPHEDFAQWKEAFSRIMPDLRVVWHEDADLHPSCVDYLLAWDPGHGTAARFPALKAILCAGAGIDHLLRDPDWPHDIPLVRMGGEETATLMEEYVTWACLSLMRETRTWALQQERHVFHRHLTTRSTRDTTVGIMGMGHLGTRVAHRLSAFGFGVRGWSRTPRDLSGIEVFAGDDGIADFLSRTDILVSLLPSTPRTRDLIDRKLLSHLPRGAGLVNVGRGDQLREGDLMEALDEGRLSGAILDVFRHEPLPPDSPLWDHPAITITPHAAAEASRIGQVSYLAGVIADIERGGTPELLYRPERGY
ncbi:2-hydroxyacid dehydrogenase [Novacetimonas pomaceti]|uniref:Glyoxylate/hydroxypyruvate reductase A n=1 Tax=Novacetimonas pomaceti TaxID=2021998 RepID=A0ABX5P3A0_9PROT|nr:glyoxylate/hydroxypyruvate reductase A [Novacetimonas pomaceti]PYD48217.1 glyoxylate/hydroxypyruvate reductase A [Novacetimonas pomaceti]